MNVGFIDHDGKGSLIDKLKSVLAAIDDQSLKQ